MVKYTLIFCLTLFSYTGYGQFGFQRSTAIDVMKMGETKSFPWAGGIDYGQFSNIDLNFDGVMDLFVFDRTCNKVMTFIQNGGVGETNFVYAPEYESLFPADLHDWALLSDYDCDGKPDIFTYALGGGRVFRNVGNATDGHSFELVEPLLVTNIYGGDTYMYLSSPDIPGIVDVDGDGDKDILAFGVLGRAVEYHKNLSMELYGVCDSLVFETMNLCWGRFRENNETNEVTLWDTLEYPCRSVDLTEEFTARPTDAEERHSGSTVLALDMDNSGVLDLVLGDASYSNLVLLINYGAEVNTNSGMGEQDNAFPSTSVSVDLPIFPAAYHVDLNNDGIRDLVAAPNSKIGSQNVKSVWRYQNEGADLMPDFVFQEEDFLQKDMIDAGTSSLPVFFDHNGDGLKDLLVSSQGQFDPVSGNQISKIAYYENVGTATDPEFLWMTDDYQGISEMGIGSSLVFYPTFGDLDGDGDEDMILGEYTGYCYYLQNTGGAGNPAIFNTFVTLLNSEGGLIFDGTYTYPSLVDLDRDGDKDLVIGKRTGKLQYFENVGVGSYSFQFVTNFLGGVDVSGVGFIEGHAIPQFVDVDGEYQLLVGSKRGYVYYFDDIEENVEGTFHLVDSIVDHINIGTYSAPTVYNLNGNNRLEMVLGNRRGGVVLYESAPTTNIGLSEISSLDEIKLFPNPANEMVNVQLGTLLAKDLKKTELAIYDLTGACLYKVWPQSNSITLDVSSLASGTYLVEIVNGERAVQKKLVVQ